MKKQEFLDMLRDGLSGSSDGEAVLDFYREMIEDRMEEGMEEEAAVSQLGSVEEILARCVQGLTASAIPSGTDSGTEAVCGISRVEIRERDFDVAILETAERTYSIEESSAGGGYHDVLLENGTLRIVRSKQQTERRLFFNPTGKLTLYLPKGEYGALDVTTASGDIKVQQNFRTVHITGASGDVALSGSFAERVTVQTSSGDLELSNVVTRKLGLCSASGDMQLERVCAEALTLETRSGDLKLQQVLSKGDFLCSTVSGDISLWRCDGPQMRLTTVSGDLSGSLLMGKQFTGHTVSGELRFPDGTPQGSCFVSTVSGDAKLSVED